jgi:8-oxo-dGTP pyrophosphatase MutT (NUDIX family)
MQNFYYFFVAGYTHPLGYIFRPHAEAFPWAASPSTWAVDPARRAVTLLAAPDATPAQRSAAFNAAVRAAVGPDSPIKKLRSWSGELVPVYYSPTPSGRRELVMDVDRTATDLVAFAGYGVHMTGYVRDPASGEIRIWVPRRSFAKSSYPGMLDNTVGGALQSGESPLDCIVREAEEELCIPPAYTRARVVPCGMLSAHLWNAIDNPAEPAYEREVMYLYELELDDPAASPSSSSSSPPTPILRVGDGEVADVSLMSVPEIKRRLANGEFKPNTVLTYLAFFIRRGIITAENEPDLEEVVRRMNRPYDMFVV